LTVILSLHTLVILTTQFRKKYTLKT